MLGLPPNFSASTNKIKLLSLGEIGQIEVWVIIKTTASGHLGYACTALTVPAGLVKLLWPWDWKCSLEICAEVYMDNLSMIITGIVIIRLTRHIFAKLSLCFTCSSSATLRHSLTPAVARRCRKDTKGQTGG